MVQRMILSIQNRYEKFMICIFLFKSKMVVESVCISIHKQKLKPNHVLSLLRQGLIEKIRKAYRKYVNITIFLGFFC